MKLKHGYYEASNVKEISNFLTKINPDVWKCFTRLNINDLSIIYCVDYYILE